MKKLENILAENMHRFGTKNLSEQYGDSKNLAAMSANAVPSLEQTYVYNKSWFIKNPKGTLVTVDRRPKTINGKPAGSLAKEIISTRSLTHNPALDGTITWRYEWNTKANAVYVYNGNSTKPSAWMALHDVNK